MSYGRCFQGEKPGQWHIGAMVFLILVLAPCACSQKEPMAVLSTPEGPRKILLELAKTEQEKARGLMFRTRLDENRGMLFFLEKEEHPSFWMRNTYISLDILFLSREGVVVDLYERVSPCALDPCPVYPSRYPAIYALELKGGFVARYLVRKGDRISLALEN
jgi:uncharacterized membrane protein (UPF0127 family)